MKAFRQRGTPRSTLGLRQMRERKVPYRGRSIKVYSGRSLSDFPGGAGHCPPRPLSKACFLLMPDNGCPSRARVRARNDQSGRRARCLRRRQCEAGRAASHRGGGGAAGGVRDQFRAIGSGFAARQSAGDRSSWGLRSLAILACGKRGISGDVNCATMPLTGYV
jgi:hypothetical protein